MVSGSRWTGNGDDIPKGAQAQAGALSECLGEGRLVGRGLPASPL